MRNFWTNEINQSSKPANLYPGSYSYGLMDNFYITDNFNGSGGISYNDNIINKKKIIPDLEIRKRMLFKIRKPYPFNTDIVRNVDTYNYQSMSIGNIVTGKKYNNENNEYKSLIERDDTNINIDKLPNDIYNTLTFTGYEQYLPNTYNTQSINYNNMLPLNIRMQKLHTLSPNDLYNVMYGNGNFEVEDNYFKHEINKTNIENDSTSDFINPEDYKNDKKQREEIGMFEKARKHKISEEIISLRKLLYDGHITKDEFRKRLQHIDATEREKIRLNYEYRVNHDILLERLEKERLEAERLEAKRLEAEKLAREIRKQALNLPEITPEQLATLNNIKQDTDKLLKNPPTPKPNLPNPSKNNQDKNNQDKNNRDKKPQVKTKARR